MGFIKNLFKNDSTVVGLCDLRKKQNFNFEYDTKDYALNRLFLNSAENNILLQHGF